MKPSLLAVVVLISCLVMGCTSEQRARFIRAFRIADQHAHEVDAVLHETILEEPSTDEAPTESLPQKVPMGPPH